MTINKISGFSNLYPQLPISLLPGETFLVPVGQGVVGTFGSVLNPQLASNNSLTGQYLINLGLYSTLQMYDSGLNAWRNVAFPQQGPVFVSADGQNLRIANTTGTPVGGLITNAGAGLANGWYGYQGPTFASAVSIVNGVATAGNSVVTVTSSAGGSLWNAFVGGAINTTITFASGNTVYQSGPFGGTGTSYAANPGANYTRPPLIVFAPPPNQGAQPYLLPTAVCTISGGAINSVTVVNQGAGLLGLPQITVIPYPGDTTGGGAVLGWLSANSGQVGSGAITALTVAYQGTAVTAVPTLSFSAGGAAATAIMNFSVTSFTQTTPGVGYAAAGGAFQGGITSGSPVYTNPILDKNLSIPLFPPVTVAAATGLPALAGNFGGVGIQAVPTFSAFSTGAAPGTAAVTTVNVGGQNDTVILQPI